MNNKLKYLIPLEVVEVVCAIVEVVFSVVEVVVIVGVKVGFSVALE